jgi:2-dehydro-3-deoxy-D-arabinonate dehydratase
MSRIVRLRTPGTPRWAVERDGQLFGLEVALGSLLAMPLTEARAVVDGATTPLPPAGGKFAAPVDEQEVWACGVTYQRSRQGREEESVSASLYTAVYEARRPEVFFKSVPSRVVGDGEDVGIRADSERV